MKKDGSRKKKRLSGSRKYLCCSLLFATSASDAVKSTHTHSFTDKHILKRSYVFKVLSSRSLARFDGKSFSINMCSCAREKINCKELPFHRLRLRLNANATALQTSFQYLSLHEKFRSEKSSINQGAEERKEMKTESIRRSVNFLEVCCVVRRVNA